MYRQSLMKLTLVSCQAIALCTIVFSYPARSQIVFIDDFDRSRQFFQAGSKMMEKEIKRIEANKELPDELPENYTEKKDLKNISFSDEDRYIEYDDVGLLTK